MAYGNYIWEATDVSLRTDQMTGGSNGILVAPRALGLSHYHFHLFLHLSPPNEIVSRGRVGNLNTEVVLVVGVVSSLDFSSES